MLPQLAPLLIPPTNFGANMKNPLPSRSVSRARRLRSVACLIQIVTALFYMFSANALSAEDWPKYRRDLSNTGRSAEQSISSSNVASLLLKWKFVSDGRITGSPAVATVSGVHTVFFGTWHGSFYAVDAVTGAQIWKYSIPLSSPTPICFTLNIGCEIPGSAAAAQGIVYFGSRSGYVYALNATTGAELWKTQIADPSKGYEIWSSPVIYNGLLYIGLASHDDIPCVPGSVVALNATTGALAWTFSTIDQTSCPSGVCVGAKECH